MDRLNSSIFVSSLTLDDGVEREIERCREFACLQGLHVVEVYRVCRNAQALWRETAVHQQMVKDALAGRYTRLIVEYPDRLGLDVDGMARLVDRLNEADVTVLCVEEDAFSRSLFDRSAVS